MAQVTALVMDGEGNAVEVPAAGRTLAALEPASGFVWVAVDLSSDEGLRWLEGAGLDPLAFAALTAGETRPRCTVHGDMVLMNLRGVNLNPGAEPQDMVSLRLCVAPKSIVTCRKRLLVAVEDVMGGMEPGRAPLTQGHLIARIALRLAERAEPVVARLNERLDALEEAADKRPGPEMRSRLAEVRRVSSVLRRFMFPQRDALSTLEIEEPVWLTSRDRARVREATERVSRLAEDLDAIRDRAQVVRDEVLDVRAEAMNRQMLVLAVVAAIFLPLSLVTGLLGINVGGIPGAGHPLAFWAVCGLLLAIAGFEIWLFRRLRLLG